jgi:hypothetical protein
VTQPRGRDGRYAPDLLPDLTVAAPTATVNADGTVLLSAVVANVGEGDPAAQRARPRHGRAALRHRPYTSDMGGRLIGAVAVFVGAVLLAACGAEETAEHHAAAPNASVPEIAAPGGGAPERISGTTVHGEPVDVVLDGRDVILWFWAPW